VGIIPLTAVQELEENEIFIKIDYYISWSWTLSLKSRKNHAAMLRMKGHCQWIGQIQFPWYEAATHSHWAGATSLPIFQSTTKKYFVTQKANIDGEATVWQRMRLMQYMQNVQQSKLFMYYSSIPTHLRRDLRHRIWEEIKQDYHDSQVIKSSDKLLPIVKKSPPLSEQKLNDLKYILFYTPQQSTML
jgi:hypothetical protein